MNTLLYEFMILSCSAFRLIWSVGNIDKIYDKACLLAIIFSYFLIISSQRTCELCLMLVVSPNLGAKSRASCFKLKILRASEMYHCGISLLTRAKNAALFALAGSYSQRPVESFLLYKVAF